MTTILVTGGAGYIGSHTCKALAVEGYKPVTLDNLSNGFADYVRWGPFIKGDILDPIALDDAFKRYRPTKVVHFAALAYVGESFSEPLAYYKVNVSGLINVLDAMIRNSVKKIIFSSSCATYGIPDSVPIAEGSPQRPISPYGRSKLVCEQIIKDTASAHGLYFGILRYFNACGADSSGLLAERHNPETHLIPLTIDAASGKGPPLNIFGADHPTPDGTCERDFIHVSDLATAHVAALRYLDKDTQSFEANLGTGRAYSVRQVVSTVERIIGKTVPLTWGPRRPGDPASLFADVTLAMRLLDFYPRFSNLDTIVETAWKSRR
jgi:UDP-arabinose 4-epimerase